MQRSCKEGLCTHTNFFEQRFLGSTFYSIRALETVKGNSGWFSFQRLVFQTVLRFPLLFLTFSFANMSHLVKYNSSSWATVITVHECFSTKVMSDRWYSYSSISFYSLGVYWSVRERFFYLNYNNRVNPFCFMKIEKPP